MAIFNDIDNTILTEAYYGKPKEFKSIESKLDVIIKKIYENYDDDATWNINELRELYEIENIFTKFFNVDEVSITFYTIPNPLTSNNAFTIPSSFGFIRRNKNNKQLVDSTKLYLNVNIDTGLVYSLKLSAEEIVAVILHEMGHDFDASVFMTLSKLGIQIKETTEESIKHSIITSVAALAISNKWSAYGFQYINQAMSSAMTSIPGMSKIIHVLNRIVMAIVNLIDTYNTIKWGIDPELYLIQMLSPNNVFGYGGEKFADSFATSYGYGKEIMSFNHKLADIVHGSGDTFIPKIPALNIGYDLVSTTMMIVTLPLDPHPAGPIRIQAQLNKLKRDLKDPNLDPKIRKELLENIRDMEDYIKSDVFNTKEITDKGRVFSFCYNWVMINVFKGKLDLRELFEVVWKREL